MTAPQRNPTPSGAKRLSLNRLNIAIKELPDGQVQALVPATNRRARIMAAVMASRCLVLSFGKSLASPLNTFTVEKPPYYLLRKTTPFLFGTFDSGTSLP